MTPVLRLAEHLGPALPAVTLVLGILLVLVPAGLGSGGAWPHWPMLAVLVWAALRPRRMTSLVAFLGGLALDALAGLPLGGHAAVFVLLVAAVGLVERRARGQHLALDLRVASLLLFAGHGGLALFILLAGSSAPLLPMAIQALMTMLALPLAVHLAGAVQRGLGGPA